MLAGLFRPERRRRDLRAARRRATRTVAGVESLEPRLALAVTLVIDPSSLNLPATSSAWVAGYANVGGGGAGQPFTWLAASGSNAAHFVVPPSTTVSDAALPMIQIWGGDVSGTTTITIDTAAIPSTYANPQLAGGQLQIFVSPTAAQPSGPALSGGIAPVTNVAVTQVNPAPYLTTPDAVPFDLVEFTYLPGASSTFDLTAVNGFVVPMTLTTTDPQTPGASQSVGTRPTGISRADIGTAFGTFMVNDPQGGSFTQLRYDAAAAPFAAPPATPADQFFAIVNPWYWITNQNSPTDGTTSGLLNYWDATLDTFFQVGNTLSIDLGPGRIYGGTSSVIGGVNTYTFTNPAGRTVLTLPQPSPGYQSASFVFGNSLSYAPNTFPGGAFPAGDPGLIIVNVMAALNRGVALDGVITTPPASVAVEAAPTGASMSVVGGITVTMNTGSPHGLMPGDTVLVQGVTIAPPGGPTAAFPDGYNGSFTVLATPSATQFTYQPTPAAGTDPVTGQLHPGGGGTVTRAGQSTAAWNAFANWYGAPSNPAHPAQPYNTYAKFLHYSTIDGTDSRLGGTPIFINNQAYGFSLDENPNGPYVGAEVPSKFDGTITDGSTLTLTLNPWTASSPSAPTVVSIDTRPPQIRPGTPTPTAPGTVTWDVLFNEPVTGVSAANFALVASAGLTGFGDIQVSPASTASAAAWTVTASTGTGSGTLGLNLANNVGSITDASGQALSAGLTGQVYDVREAPPIGPTASIAIPADAPNPTSAATVTFDVTFSQPVSGLSAANFTAVAAGITGAVVQGVSGGGDTWTVTVGTGSGSGTLALRLGSATGITPAPTGLPVTSAAYTIRQSPVAPALQSIARDLPSPTDQPQVSWTVSFSEAVAGVGAANFSLSSTGLSGARITQVVQAPGTGTQWTVTALTGSGAGTLRLDMVNATGITDAEGLAPTGIPLEGQTYDVARGDVPGVRIPIAFWSEPGRRANLVWPRSLVPFTGPASRVLTVTLAATGGDGSFTARQGVRGVTVAGTGTGPEISLTGTARSLNAYLRTAGRLGYTPSGESLLPRVLSVSATTTDTLAGLDTAAILVRGRMSPGRPTIAPQTALGPTPPGTPLEITYDALLAAADVPAAATRSVEFLLGRVSTGRLELWDGAEWVRVKPRLPRFARSFEEPLLAPGGRIRWTPPAGRSGTVPAFTVRVWDGRLKSANVSQVSIDVGTG